MSSVDHNIQLRYKWRVSGIATFSVFYGLSPVCRVGRTFDVLVDQENCVSFSKMVYFQKVYVFDGDENCPYPTYQDLLQSAGDKRTAKGPKINPRTNPAVLLCTSGTTGLPKAAQLSHYAVVSASVHMSE